MSKKHFIKKLVAKGFSAKDLQGLNSEDLALLVQNAWSPEARAKAARTRAAKALTRQKSLDIMHSSLTKRGFQLGGYSKHSASCKIPNSHRDPLGAHSVEVNKDTLGWHHAHNFKIQGSGQGHKELEAHLKKHGGL